GGMALVTGLTCVLLGVLRLGFVTELLSKPIRYGYMNGIAITVLVNQVPALLGVEGERRSVPVRFAGLLPPLYAGAAVWADFAVGAASLIIMLLLGRHTRLPSAIFGVVAAIAMVSMLELEAHLPMLGVLPQGLPSFVVPLVPWEDVGAVVAGGMAAALLSVAE